MFARPLFLTNHLKLKDMTREKEIKKQADKSAAKHADSIGAWSHHRMGFINGAEWADRTMINKACKWLEKNVCIGYNFSGDKNTLTIVDDFRKAMKGE